MPNLSSLQTRHFKVDTIDADVLAVYQALAAIAARWDRVGITRLRLFHAGICFVYVSITARTWLTLADMNDPEWQGDAEDCLVDQRGLRVRRLYSAPAPQHRWKGQWRELVTADGLAAYAQERIARLQAGIAR